MKNKKAWLRIVEAFIAILLIAGVLSFIFINKVQKPGREEAIKQTQRIILDEIENDNSLRRAVLSADNDTIKVVISKRLPNYLDFTIRNCELDGVCGLPNLAETYTKNEIFADEVIISANLTQFTPRKLKLFIWEK